MSGQQGNAMDEETFNALLLSLASEQEYAERNPPSWSGKLVDCGAVYTPFGVQEDSSACFWLCMYFQFLYITPSGVRDFAFFKRETCKAPQIDQPATPDDIQRTSNNLNVPIRVYQQSAADGSEYSELYQPTGLSIYKGQDEVRLVLANGHYQLWALDQSQLEKYQRWVGMDTFKNGCQVRI